MQQRSTGLDDEWNDRVQSHRTLLERRGLALSAERRPPVGEAAGWYWDVVRCVPRNGQRVAGQLARLCGEDSEVTVPWRSLADAVAVKDKAQRTRAYVEGGVKVLKAAGWLEVETVGKGRGARTSFRLLPGDPGVRIDLPDPVEADDEEYELVAV